MVFNGMDANAIGKRLKTYRGNKTVKEISDATGVGESAIRMYETGARIPRDEAKIKLAAFFGVSVEELFFADQPDQP